MWTVDSRRLPDVGEDTRAALQRRWADGGGIERMKSRTGRKESTVDRRRVVHVEDFKKLYIAS